MSSGGDKHDKKETSKNSHVKNVLASAHPAAPATHGSGVHGEAKNSIAALASPPTPVRVMTAEELLRTMRSVLVQEREAIRCLDADAVGRATHAKEQCLTAVRAAPADQRAALIAALGELRDELRRNLVLLAHARDYLRDAVELCTTATKSRGGRLQAKL